MTIISVRENEDNAWKRNAKQQQPTTATTATTTTTTTETKQRQKITRRAARSYSEMVRAK